MHVVIAAGGMPFGPRTPELASLGGSETAALMLAKALASRGHLVSMFCNLPRPPAPDACQPGTAPDGVCYHDLREFGDYVAKTEHDLTIGLRDPQFMGMFCKSKKKVLWAHDIFTKRGMARALDVMGWTFDEIWAVSEWHRKQIHEATGYPLENIVALRNGIVRYDDVTTLYRDKKSIIYASRPERGLDNLIMPGGVMDNLPDYTLTVAMYEHFPEHMRGYYEQIMARMKAMPNVRFVGGKPNHELRRMIADSAAYIYPTQFEETSCILARECIEQLRRS
jgi:glycosyltransferase involved in cell wall biosynthesis